MKRNQMTTTIKYLIAILISIIWILPFLGIVMTSIRPMQEVIYGWWNLKPFTPSMVNYINAWNHPTAPLSRGTFNSLLVAFPSTLIPIFAASLAAYGFARFRLPLLSSLFILVILLMALPQQMIAIPIFQLMKNLNLLNTYTGLILIHSAWGMPWIIFFLPNFFITLPIEIEESAKIDGASDFVVFSRIILPVSWPALVSSIVLQFMWVWSDFFLALILVYTPNKLLATQRIPLMRGQYHVDWGVLTAASIISMIAPLFIFAFLQKYYIKGLIGWTTK